MGAGARQRVIEEFSLGAVVKQYDALYQDLVARPRRQ